MKYEPFTFESRRTGLSRAALSAIFFLSASILTGQQPGIPPGSGNYPSQTPTYFQPGSTASETLSGTDAASRDSAPFNSNRYASRRSDGNPYSQASAQRQVGAAGRPDLPSNPNASFGMQQAGNPRFQTQPAPLQGQPFGSQQGFPAGAVPSQVPAIVAAEPAMTDFSPGELVAIVGEEPILAADLFALVDPMLVEAKEKASEEQYKELREKLMRQALAKTAQTKMLAQYFVGEQLTGKALEERKSAQQQIDKKMTSAFFEMMVPRMLEQQKVDTTVELDRILREEGSSLAAQQRSFKDSMMAQEAMRKHIPKTFEITAIEMRDRYEEKIGDWKRPAKAKFQILTAQFSKTASREEAFAMINELGKEVVYGGSFEAVAKQKSHGSHASDGGRYDWTAQGSLKSTKIDEIVFSIPLRRLSQVFEDEDGFHIVEVLDRESARTVPFEEAQDDIRESLVEFRKQQAQEKLLEKLQSRTSIWSKWPSDIPNAKPLSDYYGTVLEK